MTILRNASTASKGTCVAQWSRMRSEIARILKEEGYISAFKEIDVAPAKKQIEVTLKYVDGVPAITGIERHSRPGCRLYYGTQDIPRVLGGLGISILTTSKGLMKDSEARRQQVGGELIARVW